MTSLRTQQLYIPPLIEHPTDLHGAEIASLSLAMTGFLLFWALYVPDILSEPLICGIKQISLMPGKGVACLKATSGALAERGVGTKNQLLQPFIVS